MLAGKLYDPSDAELAELRLKAHKLSRRYNNTDEDETELRGEILAELTPNAQSGLFLQGPVYFDYGIFTRFGKNCYANFNFTVLDCCPVTIGDDVFFRAELQPADAHARHAPRRAQHSLQARRQYVRP